MPIRFRCAYCNQLMGISTRKAGTVVRCPKCAGEIIVPVPEGAAPPAEATEQAGGPEAFDDPKFEQILNEPVNGAAATNAGQATQNASMPAEVPISPPAALPPPKRLGLFLSLGMLTVSLLVIVLLLILVFVLGLLIGRQTMADGKSASLPFSGSHAPRGNPPLKTLCVESVPRTLGGDDAERRQQCGPTQSVGPRSRFRGSYFCHPPCPLFSGNVKKPQRRA